MRSVAATLMIAGGVWYAVVIGWWILGTLLFAIDYRGNITGSVTGDVIFAVLFAAWSGARYALPGLLAFVLGFALHRFARPRHRERPW